MLLRQHVCIVPSRVRSAKVRASAQDAMERAQIPISTQQNQSALTALELGCAVNVTVRGSPQ